MPVFHNVDVCVSVLHAFTVHYSLMMAIFSGPGRFTIINVTVGAGRDLINVTFVQVSHVMCDDNGLLSATTMKLPHMH